MRRGVVAVAVLLVSLSGSGYAASAAGMIQVEIFPSEPRAGQLTTIQLRTFWLLEGTPPAVFPEKYPWSVAAISSRVRRLRIRMQRESADPYLWRGTVRFSSPGRWTVCVLNFPCRSKDTGRVQVTVRHRRAPIDVWDRLERPLRTPTIARGSPCPTSVPDPKGDLTRIPGHAGTAWGEGPAYPAGLDSGEGKPIVRYVDPIPRRSEFYGSAWFGNKVLWTVDPVYSGPVLIRGRQLDGPNEIRFDGGRVPPRMLTIQPRKGTRDRPSYTRVRAAGCYAYQIDGLGFTNILVFEAIPF